jgi:hypothetical protein
VFSIPTGTDDILFPDDAKIMLGAGSDLQLYHDAQDSYVVANNTTTLKIRNTSGNIELQPKTGEVGVKAIADGAVELYHNNVKKLETTSTGVTAQGTSPQFISKSVIGTDAHEAGGGFDHVGSSTQGSRLARMWLDADGANFSGSDYYYIEKTGGGGVNHILQPAQSMSFSTQGSARMTIDANGIITKPAQPAFLAELSGVQSDIALNTAVVCLFATERFDQNSDFNTSNYTFTAPVTGKYQLNTYLRLQNVDTAATYYHIYLTTSNRVYFDIITPYYSADPTYLNMAVNVLADMDANDTAKVHIYQAGGTQQTDLGQNNDSHFSGYLVC